MEKSFICNRDCPLLQSGSGWCCGHGLSLSPSVFCPSLVLSHLLPSTNAHTRLAQDRFSPSLHLPSPFSSAQHAVPLPSSHQV